MTDEIAQGLNSAGSPVVAEIRGNFTSRFTIEITWALLAITAGSSTL